MTKTKRWLREIFIHDFRTIHFIKRAENWYKYSNVIYSVLWVYIAYIRSFLYGVLHCKTTYSTCIKKFLKYMSSYEHMITDLVGDVKLASMSWSHMNQESMTSTFLLQYTRCYDCEQYFLPFFILSLVVINLCCLCFHICEYKSVLNKVIKTWFSSSW